MAHNTLYYHCTIPFGDSGHKVKAVNAARLEADVCAIFAAGVRNLHLTHDALEGYNRRQAEVKPVDNLERLKQDLQALAIKERAELTAESSGIVHIVLFRWTEAATPEAIDNIMQELRALKGKIEGIVDLTCGANFSERSQGFTHALVVRFTDRQALEAYGPHPAHQRVVQNLIAPIRENALAVDYEI